MTANAVSTSASAAPAERAAQLARIRAKAKRCQACPLYKLGTQTVFGEGPVGARLLLIGEQPGDKEDLAGHPFVGPAGHLLDRALAEAGIDRTEVYVTNAVKHFKWRPAGKRRLHQKPNSREILACRPWLEQEIDLVQPELLVALGATAAQSLMGRAFRVTANRGRVLASPQGRPLLATVHPSSVLRAPPDQREAQYQALVADLKKIPRGKPKPRKE
jgi:DNA polymerase